MELNESVRWLRAKSTPTTLFCSASKTNRRANVLRMLRRDKEPAHLVLLPERSGIVQWPFVNFTGNMISVGRQIWERYSRCNQLPMNRSAGRISFTAFFVNNILDVRSRTCVLCKSSSSSVTLKCCYNNETTKSGENIRL